jgi:hypothetical protein
MMRSVHYEATNLFWIEWQMEHSYYNSHTYYSSKNKCDVYSVQYIFISYGKISCITVYLKVYEIFRNCEPWRRDSSYLLKEHSSIELFIIITRFPFTPSSLHC